MHTYPQRETVHVMLIPIVKDTVQEHTCLCGERPVHGVLKQVTEHGILQL